jgi:hypothetical protein
VHGRLRVFPHPVVRAAVGQREEPSEDLDRSEGIVVLRQVGSYTCSCPSEKFWMRKCMTHLYGHGRFETLSAFAVGMILRGNTESAALARQVERYRLKLAYPRGVDDNVDSTKR